MNIITLAGAAEQLDVSKAMIIKWINEGRLERSEEKIGRNKTVTMQSFTQLKESEYYKNWYSAESANNKKETTKEETEPKEKLNMGVSITKALAEFNKSMQSMSEKVWALTEKIQDLESEIKKLREEKKESIVLAPGLKKTTKDLDKPKKAKKKKSNFPHDGLEKEEIESRLFFWKQQYKISANAIDPKRKGASALAFFGGKGVTEKKLVEMYDNAKAIVDSRTKKYMEV